jgi:uncharacterized RDD family membrane protein YckC
MTMTDQRPNEPPPAPSGGSSDWGREAGASPGFQIRTVATEQGPAAGIEYAELPIRIGAYIVDAVILFVCYAVVASILVTLLVISGAWFITWVITAVLYAAASAIYFIWSWTNLRASPGQKILNLETVRASDGATLDADVAIRRYLYLFGPFLLAQIFSFGGFAVPLLGSLVGLLSLVYAIWLLYTVSQSPKRQGFHDVQAGTVVVRRAVRTA